MTTLKKQDSVVSMPLMQNNKQNIKNISHKYKLIGCRLFRQKKSIRGSSNFLQRLQNVHMEEKEKKGFLIIKTIS